MSVRLALVPRRVTLCALALVAGLLAFSPPAVAGGRKVPHGFYGAMWDGNASVASSSLQNEQWGVMAASGVESVRVVFPWAAAQPQRHGPFDFSDTDSVVARAARVRIRLLPVVIYAPRWAAQNHRPGVSPPRHPSDYAAYLRALVRRYGPRGSFWRERPEIPRRPVREWQIWNEPNIRTYWNVVRGRYGRTTGFARLLRAAYRAVKRSDRRARVVLPGLPSVSWRVLDLLYRKGHIRRYFDVAAVHPFTKEPRNSVRIVKLFRGVMRRHGDARKPIYVTELTWSAARGRSRVLPRERFFVTTDRGVARRLAVAYRGLAAAHRALRVQRVYWGTWASGFRARRNIFDYVGLTRFDGSAFTARPALRAYRRSARRYEGCIKTRTGTCR